MPSLVEKWDPEGIGQRRKAEVGGGQVWVHGEGKPEWGEKEHGKRINTLRNKLSLRVRFC